MKVIIAAAGTGGHINPGIAIANKIKEKEKDSEIIWVGTTRGIENDLVPRAGYELKTVEAYGISKKISLKTISNNFKTIEKDYNKKAIDFILTRIDEKLISILNKNFDEVIRIYAGDLIDKDFDGFKKIEDDIKEMKDKDKDEKYIEKYKEHAIRRVDFQNI